MDVGFCAFYVCFCAMRLHSFLLLPHAVECHFPGCFLCLTCLEAHTAFPVLLWR
jgi:hypothetical protein